MMNLLLIAPGAETHQPAPTWTAAGRSGVPLTLEDVSQLVRPRNPQPSFRYCKKIRDGAGYRGDVTDYLRDHLEVEFTTSLCPDCKGHFFPEACVDLRETLA